MPYQAQDRVQEDSTRFLYTAFKRPKYGFNGVKNAYAIQARELKVIVKAKSFG
jgi:hypothetical protein